MEVTTRRQVALERPAVTAASKVNVKRLVGRTVTYALLLTWAFISLFPIYWTITTSFKSNVAVIKGPTYIPWRDFDPTDLGWRSVTQGSQGDVFIHNFKNSFIIAIFAGLAALILGSLAGYGLARFNYKFGPWRNRDISFWFLSQLILPPVAVIMPILILYRELHLIDSRLGLVILYTVANLPIVVWIMRDQFNSIPVELEQAALVDGATIFGAFTRIVIPVAGPGLVAAFILVFIFCWNEYFFSAVLSRTNATTVPYMVAAQVSSQGVKWWSMAAIATAAITPLIVIGVMLERYIVKGLTAGAVK
ncbi:MAG: multiple sugar transport system permease protein [Thermomicrobiales bacterium]|nr:multiple sugar transport system permease protein [Thermomicrobiales bacterium]